jgi:hypothetical protein
MEMVLTQNHLENANENFSIAGKNENMMKKFNVDIRPVITLQIPFDMYAFKKILPSGDNCSRPVAAKGIVEKQ